MPGEGRRSQVLGIVHGSSRPLDDDQIAAAAQVNRVYVNMICRQLAAEGLIVRSLGPDGKLVNIPADGNRDRPRVPTTDDVRVPRLRRRSAQRGAGRIEELIESFAAFVTAFETSEAFPGPSLFFHLRAAERRRRHQTVASLPTRSSSNTSRVTRPGERARVPTWTRILTPGFEVRRVRSIGEVAGWCMQEHDTGGE